MPTYMRQRNPKKSQLAAGVLWDEKVYAPASLRHIYWGGGVGCGCGVGCFVPPGGVKLELVKKLVGGFQPSSIGSARKLPRSGDVDPCGLGTRNHNRMKSIGHGFSWPQMICVHTHAVVRDGI